VSALADDLDLALELAALADEVTLPRYRAADLAVSTKPDLTPVTEADTAAERAIRERLGSARPDDGVLGEEFGDDAGRGGGRRWIVDPIDGTKNYVRGIPVWATLIALQDGDELTVGVVSAPALGRRWWAARGLGGFVSDAITGESRQLRVSAVNALADAQVSLAGLDGWLGNGRREALIALVRATWRSRGFGDFWAHMLVAEGAVDVAVDAPGVSLWDVAAPLVIVEEAGGRFSDLTGQRTATGGEALASNGLLHDAALAIVGRH